MLLPTEAARTKYNLGKQFDPKCYFFCAHQNDTVDIGCLPPKIEELLTENRKIGGHLTNSIALQIGKVSPDFYPDFHLLDQHES